MRGVTPGKCTAAVKEHSGQASTARNRHGDVAQLRASQPLTKTCKVYTSRTWDCLNSLPQVDVDRYNFTPLQTMVLTSSIGWSITEPQA